MCKMQQTIRQATRLLIALSIGLGVALVHTLPGAASQSAKTAVAPTHLNDSHGGLPAVWSNAQRPPRARSIRARFAGRERGDTVYPLMPAAMSATPDWTDESDHDYSEFGYAVASAGDVNGDGYDDVIIGAPSYDDIETDEGWAFVYHGSASGLSSSPDWTAQSNQASALFGYSVAGAGDVNGDGYDDVIIGAPSFDNGETDEGRVYVFLGSSSGLSATPAWTVESNQAFAEFGIAVASAGDVNGDGYDDVIVGAYYYGTSPDEDGWAFVYHGSASGLDTVADWTARSGQSTSEFGYSVGSAGDVNGDGYDDVIVGADAYDGDLEDEGQAFVYHGSATGLSTSANWTARGGQAGAFFGWSVASAGDVNNDGYDDVIVGAYAYSNGQTEEGRAFVYHGSASGLSTSANWTAESDLAGAFFGNSVASAGDVNNDGYGDVIIGANHYDDQTQTYEGWAFIYHGWASGLRSSASWTAQGDQNECNLGWSVAAAGNVNGDTAGDVIVGAPYYDVVDVNDDDRGQARVYLGDPTAPPATVSGLAGSRSNNDLQLSWTPVTQDKDGNPITVDHYVVYRRVNEPYFQPTPGDLLGTSTTAAYIDPLALGNVATNYFYVVTAVDGEGREGAPSSPYGEFDFSLTPGS